MMKRHLKKSSEHPQGAIAEREGSIHVSNLMLQAVYELEHPAATRPGDRHGRGARRSRPSRLRGETRKKPAKKPAKKAKA